ncbi:hypothetical protein EB75_09470 [Mycobacterium sp. ST-F2]|uniref:DUF2330 domain-containing protein n=1 Tax=Mycobacterium sp. ST-F2 TaxID=1490484 RepID=UPI00093A1A09|nr:DUF2330 domain-containing protein [Mycobacterium sp. ST-F2]OKH86009.1 hypothetical protein EB75_09470 [Mycobacterium sp. ST-F2]
MAAAYRSLCVLLLMFATLTANIAAPAWACGCGAYIPDRAGAAVVDERALIAWDGRTEDILMSFGVRGTSDRAAWVMPVPSAAHVTLGDAAVFDELARITAPRVEYRDSWWPTFDWLTEGSRGALESAGARPGGVKVLSNQRIGPFDVTRLAGDDPAALAGWLTAKGFLHPDGLDANLAPYVAAGWEIVAIQLTPDAAGATLSGTLQPLRLSFASDKAVYPMRLSRSATAPQSVDLYVLADHRMDPSALPVPGNAPTLQYAGPVDAPALADYRGRYLTRWTNYLGEPHRIDGDYVFARAATDSDYAQVIYRTRNRGDVTGLALIAAALGGVVLVAALWWRRRRQAR